MIKPDAVSLSIDSFPQQLKQAFEESQLINFPEEFKQVKNILVE